MVLDDGSFAANDSSTVVSSASTNGLHALPCTLDELQDKQKLEKKILQDKIAGMRKNIPANQRQRRRQMLVEIQQFESQLKARHEKEVEGLELQLDKLKLDLDQPADDESAADNDSKLNAAELLHADDNEEPVLNSTEDVPPVQQTTPDDAEEDDENERDDVKKKHAPPYNKNNKNKHQQQERVSKAQRRRDKKTEKASKAKLRMEAETSDVMKNSLRELERTRINSRLQQRNLRSHEVPGDGDCLFSSVAHQLGIHRIHFDADPVTLRKQAAKHILQNSADYRPFMIDEHSGDAMTDKQFQQYCYLMSSTKEWGGDAELRALSDIFKVPIRVIGPTVDIMIGEQYAKDDDGIEPLNITYHQHEMSTGEHYNSTVRKD